MNKCLLVMLAVLNLLAHNGGGLAMVLTGMGLARLAP